MALVTNIPITSATVDNMSRNEYLLWQLHTGAGYALFTEILFPNAINLKKVKFNSRLELDWLSNWKTVQTSWKQLGIEKVIPVEKLIKGKFQDNFEFLQWFKKFFDANYDGREYNPLEMRNFEELPKENKLKPGGLLRQPQQLQQPKNAVGARNVQPPPQRSNAGSNVSMNSTGGGPSYAKKTTTSAAPKKVPLSTAMTTSSGKVQQNPQRAIPQQALQQQAVDSQLIEELKSKDNQLEELRSQLAETDDVVAGLEKERDFYFAKLRKIEVLCQDNEVAGTLTINDVLQILYETEDGFAAPEEADIIDMNGSNGNETGHNGS